MESLSGTLQLELLDIRQWATRQELANAIFEWIEAGFTGWASVTSKQLTSATDLLSR